MLCIDRPKSDILPFTDKIDENTALVLNGSKWDKDDNESSDDEDLNLDNLEFRPFTKSKQNTNASGFPLSKKTYRHGITNWKQHQC